MADAGARRDNTEVVEGGLAPAQELVTLAIALELHLNVLIESARRAELVDHHRVIDDQIDRRERIDLIRVAAHLGHRVAHCRQIDDGRDAREILQQHPGRTIGDLRAARAFGEPAGQRPNVLRRDRSVIFGAQQVLHQHLQREGQCRKIDAERFARRVDAVIIHTLAADLKAAARFQTVFTGHCHGGISLEKFAARLRLRLYDPVGDSQRADS